MFRTHVYVDTSVIGGCFDEEFREFSLRLFDEIKNGNKKIIVSDLVLLELEGAPDNVKEVLETISEDHIEYVFLKEESLSLANAYLHEGVIAEKSLSDARHIAIATVEKADILVSWNFKHIVNLNRIHLVNSVNLKLGYPILEIRSPREVLYEP
jgi:predicted nucleic acid-binding protein